MPAALSSPAGIENLGDLREKCRLHRASGVDVAWLVHPEQCWFEAWEDLRNGERTERGGVVASSHLPGLTVDTSALFDAVEADAS